MNSYIFTLKGNKEIGLSFNRFRDTTSHFDHLLAVTVLSVFISVIILVFVCVSVCLPQGDRGDVGPTGPKVFTFLLLYV